MKNCTKCGVIIENGVNGCSMYSECSTCFPVYYPKPYRSGSSQSMSYEELNYAESQCINDCE